MADYGIIGESLGIELPQAPVDETVLNELKHKAKYSRSTEYKELRAKAQAKIEFYQRFLPNGAEVGVDVAPTAEDWRVANRVIAEFKMLFDEYEVAEATLQELVK